MSDTSLIGMTLAGRFQITGVIGEGGMATVYRGVSPDRVGEDVAIKIMNPDLAKESRFVRRFRREAKAAAMLKHPNTVQILEFGVDQNYVFLAMELLQGFDLAMLLHRERRVSDARAIQIVVQVCRALSAAHEQSIIHRDLKPDNIMLVKQPAGVASPLPGLGPNDFVKVLDFGIAKILDDDGKDGPIDPRADPVTQEKSMLTRVGTIVGTPAYMAPEQGRAEPVDARTDIYACGVLLYELVTGRVPFTGETPMQVVMRHVNEAPRPPSEHARVHPELEKLIMRALAKFPAQRQQSAEELAFELLRVLPMVAQPAPAPAAPVEDNKRTLVIESTAVATSPSAGNSPQPARGGPAPRPAAGAPARPAPAPEPANPFPTLNIEVPDDIFPGGTPLTSDPAPTQRLDPPKAPAKAPLPAAGQPAAGRPAGKADRPAGQVQVTPAPAVDLSSTLQSSIEDVGPASEDEEEAATMVKAPTDMDRSRLSLAEEAMAKALAQPPIAPIGVGLPSFSGPESVEPTLIAPGADANPHERTVVSADAGPAKAAPPKPAPAKPAPPKAPPVKAAATLPSNNASATGASSGSIDLKNLSSTVPIEAEEVEKAVREALESRAQTKSSSPAPAPEPAPTALGLGSTVALPGAPTDKPARKPTSELIPVTLGDDKPAPLGAASPVPADAPLVWEGKPKTSKLSGPTALIIGIAIGAVLVAAALGAVLLLRGGN